MKKRKNQVALSYSLNKGLEKWQILKYFVETFYQAFKALFLNSSEPGIYCTKTLPQEVVLYVSRNLKKVGHNTTPKRQQH